MFVDATLLDRAEGALAGVAIGDALGMPSQTMTREEIAAAYGRLEDFVPPVAGHPVSHGLSAAMITDDTEQSLLLADLLIRTPRSEFDHQAWANALIDWESGIRERGLRDLLGPSSKSALDALMAGEPVGKTGLSGTTNGAAMRIVPLGIATPYSDLESLVDKVAEVCCVTHNTREAIAAAAAVAAVVSCGIEGSAFEAAMPLALDAARIGAQRGASVGEADMAGRITTAIDIAAQRGEAELSRLVGTSVACSESVATAFGIVSLAKGDPWTAAIIAANIGDDTDTIGAIAAGMAGACSGAAAFPSDRLARVTEVNNLDLKQVAEDLLAVRASHNLEAVQ